MRWKYRKLLMNLANAVEALSGPEAQVRPTGARGAARGEGRPRRGGHRRGQRRGGSRPAGRPPPAVADASGEWQGGSSWQSLARGAGSIEAEFLNGEIVLLGALHGVPTPVNALLQRLAVRAAAEGPAPGSWTIEDLSGRRGFVHGE